MTRAVRWVLIIDDHGLLIPARAYELPGDAKTFRTRTHAEDVAEKLNADLSAESVEHDFGEGARP